MLPCLRNYYYAAQVAPLLYWCDETYTAHCKGLKFNLSSQFPTQAAIADTGLMGHLETLENTWLTHTFQI